MAPHPCAETDVHMFIDGKWIVRYVPYATRLDFFQLGKTYGVEILEWAVSTGTASQEEFKPEFKRITEDNPRIQPGESVWLRTRRLKGTLCLFSQDFMLTGPAVALTM